LGALGPAAILLAQAEGLDAHCPLGGDATSIRAESAWLPRDEPGAASPERQQAPGCGHLDENSIGRSSRDVDHERAVAIYDLLERNTFFPNDSDQGPFALHLSITGSRLMFDIRLPDGTPVIAHLLSLSPLRRIVKDYYTVCDSYYAAIRTATPDRIEALDMGRRGLHDEGSHILMERLKRKVTVDSIRRGVCSR